MQLSELNPFIRYSFKITASPKSTFVMAKDCRLFYVLKGKGRLLVKENEHPLKMGTLMLWQRGVPYRFVVNDPAEIISINFDLTSDHRSRVAPYEVINVTETTDFLKYPRPLKFTDFPGLNSPIVLQDCSDLLPRLDQILIERTSQMKYCSEKSTALLKNLIIDIVRRSETHTTDSDTDSRLDNVIKYIHEHYREPLKNEFLASLAGYHPYYLNRVFVETKGKTLHQYVLGVRISTAEQMLISTDKPISIIAEETGFNNPLSFTAAFKTKLGITPAEFRKKYLNSI